MTLSPFHRAAFSLCIAGMVLPALPAVANAEGPYEQDFILTAYYSPLPDQCCYVKGNFEADKILNGNGTHGADGTAVYPGMLAAPASYAFGTIVALPGLGVLTVHDRGGAIKELQDAHRLDVWAGAGEEGLARALAFGVKRIRGTVYPPGTHAPQESIALTDLPAPLEYLHPYVASAKPVPTPAAKVGENNLSVTLLQEGLKQLGYFSVAPTGFFGDVTASSLATFLKDHGLTEPTDTVTEITSAYIQASLGMKNREELLPFIGPESSQADLVRARKVLRYLGYYHGRTLGAYDDKTKDAVMAFQKDNTLIADASSAGAGRIGPLTRGRLAIAWKAKLVAAKAQALLLRQQIVARLQEEKGIVTSFLSEGSKGDDVRALQKFLAQKGLLPADRVTGSFGALTKEALLKYQLTAGIVKSASDKGAGTVGPATLQALREAQAAQAMALVHGYGIEAL